MTRHTMHTAIQTRPTCPFHDQRPGTGGLRRRVSVFAQLHYVENYIQSVLDVLALPPGAPLVVGGDGRFGNRPALKAVIRVAAANGIGTVITAPDGLLSTPAASLLIRHFGAAAGIILSASHNPAGPDGDFGIKLNIGNGGPAPESVTDAIAKRASEITTFKIASLGSMQRVLGRVGVHELGGVTLQVVDAVGLYADCMAQLFDFGAIRALFTSGFRMRFDAMHAVTGPYACELLERRLGAPTGTVCNGEPREDFGGLHADPNLVHAHALVTSMHADDAPDFGAASDGDGDRNMILGRGIFVTPSDSLAVITAHAAQLRAFRYGIRGVARSLPTSQAVDRVAEALGIACYETPSGWRSFGTLLDSGRVAICGEESFGTGGNHIREKDGLWAVLCWLNILAIRRQSVAEIMRDHWMTFGRNFCLRYDYEHLPRAVADAALESLRARLPELVGQPLDHATVRVAEEYDYVDPVDGSVSTCQGIRIITDDARVILRISSTGTAGVTIRLYLERHERDPALHGVAPQIALASLSDAVLALTAITRLTGRPASAVMT